MPNVYSIELKRHVQMSHVEATKHDLKHWGDIGFSYSPEIYETDKKEILSAMKIHGYAPEHVDKSGKAFPFRGAWHFKRVNNACL